MSEQNQNNSQFEGIEDVMSAIASDIALKDLERRGHYVMCIAAVAGEVLKAAMMCGVPHALAEEMARDYWNGEMAPLQLAHLAGLVEDEEA